MTTAYKVLYALAVWPVALILAVIGAWWPLTLVLACGLFEWLGVPERVGAWLGVMAGDVVSVGQNSCRESDRLAKTHVGESDRLAKTHVGTQPLSELADRCGRGSCHGQRRGSSQVKSEIERVFVTHYSSFLRCLKGLVCAITSLSLRRKEPNRPSMNQGAVK